MTLCEYLYVAEGDVQESLWNLTQHHHFWGKDAPRFFKMCYLCTELYFAILKRLEKQQQHISSWMCFMLE